MRLAARAAALRGDDFQHVVGLYHAGRVLTDPHLDSVSIEDADGGAFDDIVIRPKTGVGRATEYIQVKASVYLGSGVNDAWLTKVKTGKGRSPLQHFHDTWRSVRAAAEPYLLKLITNKNFDNADPILGMIDLRTESLHASQLEELGPRSNGGKQLAAWATHLGIDIGELIAFLADVQFVHISEHSMKTLAAAELRNAGLRCDEQAVLLGVAMVRDWVTNGAGRQVRQHIQAKVAALGLLGRGGELVLAVHAIDNLVLDRPPNSTVDITHLYPDVSPFERRELLDPDAWELVVLPDLERARRDLSGFRSKHLRVEAAMRLPLHFAVGRTFSDVAGWVLSTDQRGTEWRTDAPREPAEICSATKDLGRGNHLAVGISLTHDVTSSIDEYLTISGLPVARLVVLTTPAGSSETAVSGPGWAASAAREMREQVRTFQDEIDAKAVHLFISSPAAFAMFLGHGWNLIRSTTVYDHTGRTYVPTMTLAG